MRGFGEICGRATRLIFNSERGEFITILSAHPFAVRRRANLPPGELPSPLAGVEWDFDGDGKPTRRR